MYRCVVFIWSLEFDDWRCVQEDLESDDIPKADLFIAQLQGNLKPSHFKVQNQLAGFFVL